jgi:hypothetical protein
VGHHEGLRRAVGRRGDDGEPVGELRDGELGQPFQVRLVVERGGEAGRRLGEEGEPPLALLRRQPGRLGALAAEPLALGPVALGDVPPDAEEAADLALGVVQGDGAGQPPDPALLVLRSAVRAC